MVFGSVHNAKKRAPDDANDIKDHVFGLNNGKPDRPISSDAQYLVQYRHPLESVQSFFEFKVHLGKIEDSAEKWAKFSASDFGLLEGIRRKMVSGS